MDHWTIKWLLLYISNSLFIQEKEQNNIKRKNPVTMHACMVLIKNTKWTNWTRIINHWINSSAQLYHLIQLKGSIIVNNAFCWCSKLTLIWMNKHILIIFVSYMETWNGHHNDNYPYMYFKYTIEMLIKK